jgi:hypothetical protein
MKKEVWSRITNPQGFEYDLKRRTIILKRTFYILLVLGMKVLLRFLFPARVGRRVRWILSSPMSTLLVYGGLEAALWKSVKILFFIKLRFKLTWKEHSRSVETCRCDVMEVVLLLLPLANQKQGHVCCV